MKTKSMKSVSLIGICLVIGLFPLLTGCATTHQKRSVEKAGYLDNYHQLKEGKGDEALKVYINQDVNFALYDKIILDPVSIVVSEDSDMAKVAAGDRQKMADYFYAVLNTNLSKKYQIVSSPGPGTMKLRVALTDIKSSKVVMDTISTVLPIGLAIDLIVYAAKGTHTNVGAANVEMELLDTSTGKRLAAAVDGRSGAKVTGRFDKWGKWNDTKGACDYWAERITKRLVEETDADYLLNSTK